MIKVSEKFRTELNKKFRSGIANEIVLFADFEIAGIGVDEESGSPLDVVCQKNKTEIVEVDRFPFNDFCSLEPNTYDVTKPKKLFVAKKDGEYVYEYLEKYNAGMVSANFYTGTNGDTPFFTKTIKLLYLLEKKFNGAVIYFGDDETIYPTDFTIEILNLNGEIVKTYTCNGNYGNKYEIKDEIPVNRGVFFRINVFKMNRKNVKLRISRFMLGMEFTFNTEIISSQTKKSGHPISSELPDNSFTAKIWDETNLFDPQNPNGIYYLLRGNERVESYYKYGDERVLVGTYELDGRPISENHNVTLKCKSIFWKKVTEFNGGNITGTNESPTQFANRCVKEALGIEREYFESEFTDSKDFTNVSDSPQNVILRFGNLGLYQFQENPQGIVTQKILLNRSTEPNKEVEEYLDGTKAIALDTTRICGEVKLDTTVGLAESYKIAYYIGKEKNWYSEPQDVTNPEIVIDNYLNAGSDYISKYLVKPRLEWWILNSHKYTIPYLTDITLEVGDFVKFNDKYGKTIYGFITEINASYPSAPSTDNIVVYTTDKVR